MQISTIFWLFLVSVAEAGFIIQTTPEKSSKSLKKIKPWAESSKHGSKKAKNDSFKISYLPNESEIQRALSKHKNRASGPVAHTGMVNVVSSLGGGGRTKHLKSDQKQKNPLNSLFSMQPAKNQVIATASGKPKMFASTDHKVKKDIAAAAAPPSHYHKKGTAMAFNQPIIKAGTNLTIGEFVYVDLPLNQWTQFYFTEPGQLPYSRWNFNITSGQSCTLQVVDAYCTGDRFQATRLLDSGKEIELLTTPPVPYNPVVAAEIKAGSNVNCTPFTMDAETAWSSSSWSKGQVALPAGNYKLILKPIIAPYGSGGAFVKVACQSNSSSTIESGTGGSTGNYCSYGNSNIKYVRQSVPYTQASATCRANGLQPLAVTAGTIAEAHKVLMNCAGVDSRAWISSYNGDSYGGAIGLTLHATQVSEVGAISATPDTSTLHGVLCQA